MLVKVSGKPTYFTIVGTNILLGVAPNSATTLQINYYKSLTALSDSNASNDILTNYPELYLYGALAESAPFIMQDERINTWGIFIKRQSRMQTSHHLKDQPHLHLYRCQLRRWHR